MKLVDFVPPKIIYGGKTDKFHPVYKFPSDWHITHYENHKYRYPNGLHKTCHSPVH